jgi:predicted house-cleaning noncanonical NTP pyrophosphatase (MazG superfamily)
MKYNKLVRDKIPEQISASGKIAKFRILNDEEYIKYLDKKLEEEVYEYMESKSIEELADILEVVFAITKARNISDEDLFEYRETKAKKRGTYSNKILLEKVEDSK